jgi:hypothetical protein
VAALAVRYLVVCLARTLSKPAPAPAHGCYCTYTGLNGIGARSTTQVIWKHTHLQRARHDATASCTTHHMDQVCPAKVGAAAIGCIPPQHGFLCHTGRQDIIRQGVENVSPKPPPPACLPPALQQHLLRTNTPNTIPTEAAAVWGMQYPKAPAAQQLASPWDV